MEQTPVFVSDKDWRDLIDFYFQTKALVALAEISNKDQRISVPAITELRSALDHLMRVKHVSIVEGREQRVFVETINDDPRPKAPEGNLAQCAYCKNNFLKIKGHLYRAAYDSLDSLIMSNLTDYENLVKHFDFDDICQVIPDFPTGFAKIEEARRMVVQCKMFKDIELDDTTEQTEEKLTVNRDVIEKYLLAYAMVKNVCTQIRQKALEIRAAVRRRKKAFFMPILIGVVSSVLATLLVTISIWLVQFLPGPERGASADRSNSTLEQTSTTAPESGLREVSSPKQE
ncbi:MAG TPA: hypothetical protein PLQ35_11750 [bacterium]|nr:hypothetical protein [bacterium]HQL62958.1 hypothetical protein [bacterium]